MTYFDFGIIYNENKKELYCSDVKKTSGNFAEKTLKKLKKILNQDNVIFSKELTAEILRNKIGAIALGYEKKVHNSFNYKVATFFNDIFSVVFEKLHIHYKSKTRYDKKVSEINELSQTIINSIVSKENLDENKIPEINKLSQKNITSIICKKNKDGKGPTLSPSEILTLITSNPSQPTIANEEEQNKSPNENSSLPTSIWSESVGVEIAPAEKKDHSFTIEDVPEEAESANRNVYVAEEEIDVLEESAKNELLPNIYVVEKNSSQNDEASSLVLISQDASIKLADKKRFVTLTTLLHEMREGNFNFEALLEFLAKNKKQLVSALTKEGANINKFQKLFMNFVKKGLVINANQKTEKFLLPKAIQDKLIAFVNSLAKDLKNKALEGKTSLHLEGAHPQENSIVPFVLQPAPVQEENNVVAFNNNSLIASADEEQLEMYLRALSNLNLEPILFFDHEGNALTLRINEHQEIEITYLLKEQELFIEPRPLDLENISEEDLSERNIDSYDRLIATTPQKETAPFAIHDFKKETSSVFDNGKIEVVPHIDPKESQEWSNDLENETAELLEGQEWNAAWNEFDDTEITSSTNLENVTKNEYEGLSELFDERFHQPKEVEGLEELFKESVTTANKEESLLSSSSIEENEEIDELTCENLDLEPQDLNSGPHGKIVQSISSAANKALSGVKNLTLAGGFTAATAFTAILLKGAFEGGLKGLLENNGTYISK